MAAKQQEPRLSLKLLIDEERNRVVAAEAHKEFVEILFSFLTLPMGTVIRVTSSGGTKNAVKIGCMNNLCRVVEKLSNENWETENCKSMVLHPRNPLGNYCQKLKVNIDDSWSNTKYRCSWCCSRMSWYPNVSCTCGGKTSNHKITYGVNNEGAFLQKGRTMFIISDDLQIRPACPSVLARLLSNLGLSEMDGIREMLIEVSKEQVISLLARSLVSESPLSDVFLPNPTKHETKLPERTLQTTEQNETPAPTPTPTPTPTLNLQVTLNKSTNKLLFAKATNEFFDFLCTFLTIPVGSIIHVLKRNLGGFGGCIYNLYTSVEELEDKWFGSCLKSAILNPQIAQYHNCKKQPLKLDELIESKLLLDPRPNQNFAGEPLLFIVLDNLDVKPLSSASSSLILRELKVPFRDVEDQVITVGMNEALSLLKAALTSPSSALTNGLASFLQKKKKKQEA